MKNIFNISITVVKQFMKIDSYIHTCIHTVILIKYIQLLLLFILIFLFVYLKMNTNVLLNKYIIITYFYNYN